MLHLKKILRQLTSFWLFPAGSAASLAYLVLAPCFLSASLFLYIGIRILCTKNKPIILVSFLCSFLLLGICLILQLTPKPLIEETELPQRGRLYVLPDKITVDGDQLQVEGTVQVGHSQNKIRGFYTLTSEKEQRWWQNQVKPVEIYFSGTFSTPQGQSNKNGFNYAFFLKQQAIYQVLLIEKIDHLNVQAPRGIEGFSSLRKQAILQVRKSFDAKTALYMNALLWGEKTEDFAEIGDTFASLGILHLFSLSGMHVAFFLGVFRYLVLRIFRRTIESFFWFQLGFSLIYAGMTGFSISVVRALVQKNIAASSQKFQWKLQALDCWSLTLLLHLLVNPWLLFSIGGQFSYFLSFIILFIDGATKRYSSRIVKSLLFSCLLNVATVPLLAHSFYEWQLMGCLLTFLLLPLFEKVILPVLTISFFGSLFFNSLILKKGLFLFFELLSRAFLLLEDFFNPKILLGHLNDWLQLLCFFCVFWLIICLTEQSKKVFLPILGLLVMVNSKYLSPVGTMAMIDVGQGDSLFMQAPFQRESILIDTGGSLAFAKEEWRVRKHQKAAATYSVIPFLKSQGVKTLDTLIITHGHEDHFGDLAAVSQQVKIKRLYYPKGAEVNHSLARVLAALSRKGTRCLPILAPKVIEGPIVLNVLSPTEKGMGGNDDSLVIQTKLGGKTFLLTGDLENGGEQALLKNYPNLQVDKLKVGHHGSRSSSAPSFIQQLNPEDALISCGVNNRFKHPHEETLTTLKENQIRSYRTDLQGMVYYQWTPFTKLSQAKYIKKLD